MGVETLRFELRRYRGLGSNRLCSAPIDSTLRLPAMPRQPSDDGFGEALDVASGVLRRLASAPFPPLSLTLLTARGGRDEREGGLLCLVGVER